MCPQANINKSTFVCVAVRVQMKAIEEMYLGMDVRKWGSDVDMLQKALMEFVF